MSRGLATKSNAPALRASTAASTLPKAVIMATGVLGKRVEMSLISSSPEPSGRRSEEHTSELQSLMRISYAVFCLKKKTNKKQQLKSNLTKLTHQTSACHC